MGKKTTKIKVKAKPKSKPVKAKMSSDKGGIMTAKIVAIVNKNKSK